MSGARARDHQTPPDHDNGQVFWYRFVIVRNPNVVNGAFIFGPHSYIPVFNPVSVWHITLSSVHFRRTCLPDFSHNEGITSGGYVSGDPENRISTLFNTTYYNNTVYHILI